MDEAAQTRHEDVVLVDLARGTISYEHVDEARPGPDGRVVVRCADGNAYPVESAREGMEPGRPVRAFRAFAHAKDCLTEHARREMLRLVDEMQAAAGALGAAHRAQDPRCPICRFDPRDTRGCCMGEYDKGGDDHDAGCERFRRHYAHASVVGAVMHLWHSPQREAAYGTYTHRLVDDADRPTDRLVEACYANDGRKPAEDAVYLGRGIAAERPACGAERAAPAEPVQEGASD